MSTYDPKVDCCPPFNPEAWEGKTHTWHEKLFLKDSIPTFFHIPWPPTVSKLMTKIWKQATDAGAAPEVQDFLCLTHDPTPWRSEYYLAVTKDVPGSEMARLSGTYISKVFDGPYSGVPKWIKEMDSYLATQQKKAQTYYFYYTTCPKCAKKYGHNYVVLFAQI